ncbi:MAG: STAS domain-containing protein [bacterium]|nr:STAS domain-containing protein [bacterium]
MRGELKISKRSKFSYDIIDIDGDISFDHSQNLKDFVRTEITGDNTNIILNLKQVPHLNSTALGVLIKIVEELSERKMNLFLMNASDSIKGLINLSGLKSFFKYIDDENLLMENKKQDELDNILELDD